MRQINSCRITLSYLCKYSTPLNLMGHNPLPLKCGLHIVVKENNVEREKGEYPLSRETWQTQPQSGDEGEHQ